jgi:response regulator RpfG family c-di-GMP phosphodiesterase
VRECAEGQPEIILNQGNIMSQQVNSTSVAPSTILFIDDEANILSALKRLFRPLGYNIFTAKSGAQALAILEKEPVDIVISDMRMPQMTGAEVLERIRGKWPDMVRILLTGYADITSTIAAINRGEIYRYIAKPWDDNDIVLIVRDALERKHLLAEKLRLEELTMRQNLALTVMNTSLEEKVLQRTEGLGKR